MAGCRKVPECRQVAGCRKSRMAGRGILFLGPSAAHSPHVCSPS